VLLCAYLTGCATVPSASEIAAVGYGQPLTIDWQAAVKEWFLNDLKDPLSAQYIFYSKPVPGYVTLSPVEGEKLLVGYKVVVKANAKNGFGGFVGFKPYLFLFRDNRLIFAVGPDSEMDTALLTPYE
jgi:hypothetical protein